MRLSHFLVILIWISTCEAAGVRNFQVEYDQAKGRLQVLEEGREEVIKKSKNKVGFYEQGIQLLKKYTALIKAKYLDEEGVFQEATEISIHDRENINQLTFGFLKINGLKGRVSAKKTIQFIEDHISELYQRIKLSENPDENNNSELQILVKKIQDEREKMEYIFETAKNSGVMVNKDSVVKTGLRMPASVKEIKVKK